MARQRRHAPPRKRRGRFRLIYKILSIILVIAAILVACVAFFRVNRIETTGNAHYTSVGAETHFVFLRAPKGNYFPLEYVRKNSVTCPSIISIRRVRASTLAHPT